MDKLDKIIKNVLNEAINEYRYSDSSTPYNSKEKNRINLGYNPLYTDMGGHQSNDVVSQVSTFDVNGANFKPNDEIIISDNKFIFYKVKHFHNDKINGTLDLFGKGSKGEIELRRAIDTINGAAIRNNKYLIYRIITTENNMYKAKRNNFIHYAFWEFSLDGGETWYILKPNPIQNMLKSTLAIKK